MTMVLIFFFFQAEDGIRDDLVTGVQTCALPIYLLDCRGRPAWSRRENVDRFLDGVDRALGGARAMRDQIVGAVEIEPADFADAGGDQQIRRIAGEAGAGDGVRHDLEGLAPERGDAPPRGASE